MAIKELIVDDLGQPIPQYQNNSTGDFEALKGSGGANLVKCVNLPESGVFPILIRCADGVTPLPITTVGIPVQVANFPASFEVSNFPASQAVTLPESLVLKVNVENENVPVVVQDEVKGKEINAVADTIINSQRASALFAFVQITSGTGTLKGLKVQAVINSVEVDYVTKNLDTPITSGNALIMIEGPLPLKMKLVPVVDEASTLVTTIDVQLT